jgi:2-polyprenyl-6-methoxyphenol hydroxylase-like FAD-dependent oxidoreductase
MRYSRDIGKSLIEAGAVPVEMAREFRYERADVGALPPRPLDILLLSASRPLMEGVLRRHIEAFRNIDIRTECRAARIAWSLHDETVAGVEIRSELGAIELLTADLVIDASGRGGLTMALLEDLGRERPDLEEIGVDISYATAIVNIPANHYLDCKLAFTLPHPPKQGSLGLVMPIEQRRWMVTIGQRGASERLDNWEKMLSASRDLVTTTIHDAVCNLTPVKDIHHYAFPASSWRHFERLPALPRGVLPVGDAICRFNPIYGQGMSSAALQAKLLRESLELADARPDAIAAMQAEFMGRAGSLLETPWALSTNGDLRFSDTRGVRPDNFEQIIQFEDAVFRAIVVDPVVHKAMVEVIHLLKPQSLLQEPGIAHRIELANGKVAS